MGQNEDRRALSFVLGLLTASGIFSLVVVFAASRIGFAEILRVVWVAAARSGPDVDDPPKALLAELTALGAIVENTDNPTKSEEHDNLAVQPDDRLGYVMRPNVSISAYLLKSKKRLNLDPPVLYLPSEAPLSPPLRAYLDLASRTSYRVSTDSQGLRTTTPIVSSANRVLMIGNSVGFGVGANDDQTMASQLQRMSGTAFQIVNAAVGGYDADQIYEAARKQAAQRTYGALIYVACQNDFDDSSKEAYLSSAASLLTKLSTLRSGFSNRVVVLFETYLEYTVGDVLNGEGWSEDWLVNVDYLRAELPTVARHLGFEYIDWMEIATKRMKEQGTIFGRFALYFDAAHLSPEGNQLAAQALMRSLIKLKVVQ